MSRVGALVAIAAVLLPGPGLACSCARPEGWTIDGARAGGAVFAQVTLAGERLQPMPGGDLRVYTAKVSRAIGLRPGGMISIVTPSDGARCGVTLAPERAQWIILRQQPEGWSADLCSQLPVQDVDRSEWDRRAGPSAE